MVLKVPTQRVKCVHCLKPRGLNLWHPAEVTDVLASAGPRHRVQSRWLPDALAHTRILSLLGWGGKPH